MNYRAVLNKSKMIGTVIAAMFISLVVFTFIVPMVQACLFSSDCAERETCSWFSCTSCADAGIVCCGAMECCKNTGACSCQGCAYYCYCCANHCAGEDCNRVDPSYSPWCSSSCGASSQCDGKSPNTDLTRCGCGKTYFADKCDSNCGCVDRGDNICRSSAFASDCTASSSCNGYAPGTTFPDTCGLLYLIVDKKCDSTCTFTQTVYTCDSAHCGDSKSCGGSTYYCVYDNGWKWSTSKPTNFCCSDADCDDNNPCTTDTCTSDYRCSHTIITTSITIDSSPQGSGFVSVDGVAITTPQTYSWTCGSTHTLSANSPVYPGCCPALRYIFSSWSDGGAQTHTITVPSSSTTYTANYKTQVYLSVVANPSAGGSVSGSGWYDLGTTATISATANTCYIFSNWTANWGGGYTGTANPASVSIDAKAQAFASKGNTPTETANFGYNDGASCSGTPYCSGTNRCGGSEGDTRYYDFKCQSGNCVATSSENCRCDASDSDGGQSYTTYGSCTDYTGCSGGSCQSTTYYDSCSGDTLTEYYVSGSGDSATCASTTYNCKNLGSDYICSGGRCTNCKKGGEACGSTSDCCSYYTSGTTCYYSPDCVSTGGALAPLSQPTLSFSDSFINKISFGVVGQSICEFSTCSIADSCTANTLTVGKTCSASGCSSGTSYTCNSNTHTNCQAVGCGGSTYYCTYDGSTWQWRTSYPSEVCNDNIDNDCDGKTDCSDPDCSSNPSCGTCSYSLSIDPSSGSYSDTTNTWSISATDNSNSYCSSPITYTITYSTSGSCDSSNTYVNPTSFSVSRGSTLNNAFSVKVTRSGSSCTLSLSIKDPSGNTKATGTYTVSQACSCTAWSNVGCGVSPCASDQMKQTRSCTPSGCDIEERCIVDPSCAPPTTYTLNVNSAVDILGTALAGVQITVDGTSKNTDSSGKTTFSLSTGSHTITAQSSFNGRPFSHFWDHDANADCNQNDPYDTANNPYSFTMNACTRDITAWYKVFTHFQNSAGTQGEIDYSGATISGYLLREDNQPLHYAGGATVSLEYYDGSWHSIGTTTASSSNGYFSYSWPCVAGATQIRASFTDPNWYYTSSTGAKTISCAADTTPPTTSINPNGKTWTNQDVSFTLTCSDNVGCAETKYSIIDATASCPSYASLANTGTSGTVSCNTVCQKAVCYASKDLAGNTESVNKSNTFYIDKVLPTGDININPPAPTSADQVTYTATGSDGESGLSQISIYVDNQLRKTCASSPCSWTSPTNYTAGSTHTYSAIIYDIAGNSYTVSKTFTVNAVCNNNGICEVYALNIGENQTGCPGDCKTVAYFTPSWNVLPGQEVAITVYFNDSRWDSTRDASLNLTIDGKEWTNCQVQNKKWKADIGWPGVNGVWSGTYGGKPVRITSYLGYAKLEANCTLPTWLGSGTHYFVATPTLYSKPVTLAPATSKFTVGTASIKPISSFNLFLQFLKSLLLIKIF